MTDKPTESLAESKSEKLNQADTKYNELIETYFDEGWFPTKCSEGCVVEPDGKCPHGFQSIALELGLI